MIISYNHIFQLSILYSHINLFQSFENCFLFLFDDKLSYTYQFRRNTNDEYIHPIFLRQLSSANILCICILIKYSCIIKHKVIFELSIAKYIFTSVIWNRIHPRYINVLNVDLFPDPFSNKTFIIYVIIYVEI